MSNITRRTAVSALMALAAVRPALAERQLPQADLIMVFKESRMMYLYSGETVLRRYNIDLGWEPTGDKEFEGDGRTPEGVYHINRRNPNSNFHLSLGISYPTEQEVVEANAVGLDPGGDIFIHGNSRRRGRRDWTAGCIAVRDRQIEEIWKMVPDGTPIVIRP